MEQLAEYFGEIGFHWLWFGVAMLLLATEALWGGFRFLGASLGGVAVGVLVHFYPYVHFQVQLLFFLVLAVGFIWLVDSYIKGRTSKIAELEALVRDKAWVGREIKLVNPIVNGRGVISLEDVQWRVEGEDCPAGQMVRIIDMARGLLKVEPLQPGPVNP